MIPQPLNGSRRRRVSRRGFLGGAGGGTLAAVALGADQAHAAAPHDAVSAGRIGYTMPLLTFGDPDAQHLLGTLHEAALTGLIGINTVYATPDPYDAAERVSYPPGTFVRAGGGYPSPQRWTRDAAVNAWNITSVLSPMTGRNTLWTVVDRAADGGYIVQQDNQWWDQVVWVVAGWHHYLVTGDDGFLADAYAVAARTLEAREAHSFNDRLGLFRGPGFMNDGIAGYPEPPWTPGVKSSFVLDYPHADELMCLSTNCLYHGAYTAAAGMASALGRTADAARHRRAAARLRDAVNTRLWRDDAGTYGYFLHGGDALDGRLDTSQEGAGLAFAVLFGVADADRAREVLAGAHRQPHGIVNVWPHFDRFSDDKPGRHNATVWPMVHSMFGHAAARAGLTDVFERSVHDLAELVRGSDDNFYELYNSVTGAVDGGWQTGGSGTLTHFTSQPDQAWSATGFLRLLYSGLLGLTFTTKGLRLAPVLPSGWGPVTLRGLPYRAATVDVELRGAGGRIASCTVDGRRGEPLVPAASRGHHTVEIMMAD